MASFNKSKVELLVCTAVSLWLSSVPALAATVDPAPEASAQEITAEIAQQLEPSLPEHTRVAAIHLNCQVDQGTKLVQMASPAGRFLTRVVTVQLESNGHRRYCAATLDAQRQVLVAVRDLQPGASVTAADFVPGWVDAFTITANAADSLVFDAPMVAVVPIKAGQPLYPSQVGKQLAVHPGDLVAVRVINGAVVVRTYLQARGPGAVGDNVNMVNPDSGTSLVVKVTGDRTGEIQLQ
jgi:flagella basal body P-ring formation protein FlgA